MKQVFVLTLTLRAGSSKVEPEIFAPPQTPYLGARYRQNVISWRWLLPLPTDQGVIYPPPPYWGGTPHIDVNTHTQTVLPHWVCVCVYCSSGVFVRDVVLEVFCVGSRRPRGSFFLAGSASPRPHSFCLGLGSV